MISVRSEVQVFPGPPHNQRRASFVFWYGAIAQLGERVLCKHEVVGSIPSGSTRWFDRLMRCLIRIVRETSLCICFPMESICGISDIVKRRSIRVVDRMAKPRGFSGRHSLHYLRTVFGAPSSQDDRVVKRFFQRRLTASLSVRSYEAIWSFSSMSGYGLCVHRGRVSQEAPWPTFCRVCGH